MLDDSPINQPENIFQKEDNQSDPAGYDSTVDGIHDADSEPYADDIPDVDDIPDDGYVIDIHQRGGFDVSFKEQLAKWAIQIPAVHVNSLLSILRTHDCFKEILPRDSQSLVRTPRVVETIPVPPGLYDNFGLENVLIQVLKYSHFKGKSIQLLINTDGLPISKSSGSQFWPILGLIRNDFELGNVVFVIGLYHGNKNRQIKMNT